MSNPRLEALVPGISQFPHMAQQLEAALNNLPGSCVRDCNGITKLKHEYRTRLSDVTKRRKGGK